MAIPYSELCLTFSELHLEMVLNMAFKYFNSQLKFKTPFTHEEKVNIQGGPVLIVNNSPFDS